jgi:hypothetical protein
MPFASSYAEAVHPGLSGVYLCKTLESAAIIRNHFDRLSPKAHIDEPVPIGFRMQITATGRKPGKYKINALPYDGPDRDLQEGAASWRIPTLVTAVPFTRWRDQAF